MSWNGPEKRKSKRGDVYVRAFAVSSHAIYSAYSENVSDGGMRAIFDTRFEVTTVLNLEIFLDQDPLMRKGKVIWVKEIPRPAHPGTFLYQTGIKFIP
jgi:hypothetical protein